MWVSLVAGALAVAAGGCDDPTRIREAPALDRSMRLFAVFDPDSSWHPLFIESLDVGGAFEGLTAVLYADGVQVEVGQEVDKTNRGTHPDPLRSCAVRYGSLGWNSATACLVFETEVAHGVVYELVVTAADRPTARATFRVPGPFELTHVETEGTPPGTGGITVEWRASQEAFGYFASLRASSVDCQSTLGCPEGWFVTTTDTAVVTTIPANLLEDGRGPWYVEVTALDRGLFEYLTTGKPGELFSVPPIENVEGGHGAVGAWVRRSVPAR